jgi:hypothetical protein
MSNKSPSRRPRRATRSVSEGASVLAVVVGSPRPHLLTGEASELKLALV